MTHNHHLTILTIAFYLIISAFHLASTRGASVAVCEGGLEEEIISELSSAWDGGGTSACF